MSPQQQAAYAEGFRQGAATAYQEQIRREAEANLIAEIAAITAAISLAAAGSALPATMAALAGEIFNKWLEVLRRILVGVMEAAVEAAEPLFGVGFTLENPFMAKYFEEYTAQVAGEITEGTRRLVEDAIKKAASEGLTVDKTADLVGRVLKEASPARARTIARTELIRATNGANYLQAAESGLVSTKTHTHQNDGKVRDEHRFVETVPIHQPYRNGEYFAGQLSVNCRCRDEYGLDPEALGMAGGIE